MNKKFHRDYLRNEPNLPYTAIVNKITSQGRWSIHHWIVFEDDGKFYSTNYSEGATEYQDESPWEYDDEVECVEVELKEVKKLEWVAKE